MSPIMKLMCICSGVKHEWCDKTCPHAKPHDNRGGYMNNPDCADEVSCGKIEQKVSCEGVEVEVDG